MLLAFFSLKTITLHFKIRSIPCIVTVRYIKRLKQLDEKDSFLKYAVLCSL